MADDTHLDADHDRRELVREGLTMALYVAVCLLAALTAAAESASQGHVLVLGIVWGTSLGLVLAHIYAFRLSTRLVAGGAVPKHDAELALSQVGGASAVAVLCTVPILALPATGELDAVRLLLAAFIAVVAFVVAKSSGASSIKATIYAAITLVVGFAVAVAKNILSGH